MMTDTIKQNWVFAQFPDELQYIHHKDINIVLYDRDISFLLQEINTLLNQNIELNISGAMENILDTISKNLTQSPKLSQDIEQWLRLFSKITNSNGFRLTLATIHTNMCRRFHTDINDLRLLCTYSGQGTLWLTEDNINRDALGALQNNEYIIMDDTKIQQAKTGSVLILKGAIYPQEGTKAAVHRSPTIEETGEKRLLLRIDTRHFLSIK